MIVREWDEEIRSRYDSWKITRDEYFTYSQKCWELYMQDVEGTKSMYTKEQETKIANSTTIPINIDYIYPIVNQKLALLLQNKSSHKVVSFDGRFQEYAQVLDKMKHAVLKNSTSFLQNKAAILNELTRGMGITMVMPDDYFSNGEFGIRIKSLNLDEVILDANSKDESAEDMEGFFVTREFTISKFMQVYGNIFEGSIFEDGRPVTLEDLVDWKNTSGNYSDLSKVIPNDFGYTSKSNNRFLGGKVEVKEYFDKVFTTMYLLDMGEGIGLKKVFEENIMDIEGYEVRLKDALSAVQGIYVRKTIIVGDQIIAEEILPVNEFPIVVRYFEWGGRPYKSYGMVHWLKGMQEAYTRLLQSLLLSGMLTANAGWKAPKGSIAPTDKTKWEKHGANPSVIKEYVPVEIGSNVFVPERDTPQQLPNFFPMMLEMLKGAMEYTSGVTAILQGNAAEAKVDVFSSMQQYQSAAMQRVIMAVQGINMQEETLGRIIIQFLIGYVTPGTYTAFFDDTKELNEVIISQQMAKDMVLGKWKVQAIPSTMMPSQMQAFASELMKVAQSSPNPTQRDVYTQKAFEMSDIPEGKELSKKIDVANQLQQQVGSLEQQIERSNELMKQFENRALNAEFKMKVMEMTHNEIDSITTAGAKTKSQIEIEKLKEQLRVAQNPQNSQETA